ncbi:MAG: cytochrome c oxidase subunit II [Flaviflexus sp.]|uniref:aa3-type cytochrome oxidase subunit II n=1 Tax=Flaviflexus sp. TaxID=1969482 RepID=UPI00352E7E4B
MRETQQRRRGLARFGALLGVVALAAGCSTDHSPSEPGKGIDVGFLPSTRGMTDRTSQLIDLWNGAWFAAIAVGVLVWVLVLWCVIAYRKRKNDNALPVQLRYHVPLEILYTIVPIIMVGVLFVFSTRATAEMNDVSAEPDVEIEVYGKQWSWDFNYTSDDVYFSGDRISFNDGEVGAEETLPTLYLPVDETVEFTVKSRDVIHSFWIPAFLYKIDMIPGRVNTFQVTPHEEGVYSGKCAELCGEYHAEMVFNVAVVDRETYDAEMEKLREAGNTGTRGDEYNRQYALEGADNGDH